MCALLINPRQKSQLLFYFALFSQSGPMCPFNTLCVYFELNYLETTQGELKGTPNVLS